jgi:hypothetical protein
LRPLFRQPSAAQPHLGKTFRAYTTLGRVRGLSGGRYLAESRQVINTGGLPRSAQVNFSPQWSPAMRSAAGASLAFGVSAAFQWVEDFNSPYLTPEQKYLRFGVAGLGGTGAWVAGLIATEVAAGAGAGAWAGPVGILVGGGVTFIWIKWVQPSIFRTFGANLQRDLAPLAN